MNEYTVFSKDAIKKQSTNSVSKGWLLKWKLGDTWLKSPGFMYEYMYESYAEVLASSIAKDLGIKRCLQYKPCILIIDGVRVLGCESKDYKGNNIEITLSKLERLGEIGSYRHSGYDGYRKLIQEIKKKFGLDIQAYLEDLLMLDAVTLNIDRNLWNISILTDGKGNFRECPIYDTGLSLGLERLHSTNFDELYMYNNGFKAEPFDVYFENQVKYIRSNREYSSNSSNSIKMYNYIRDNFCVNNTYRVVNTISIEQMNFTYELINQRYRSVVLNKLWKQHI